MKRTVIAALGLVIASFATAAHAESYCPNESVSENTNFSTSFTIRNRTHQPVVLHWINHNGVRQYYGTIQPGASYHQATFYCHTWAVTTQWNDCIIAFRAATSHREIPID